MLNRKLTCPQGYNVGEPNSPQRALVVDDLLVALRNRGLKLGTRADLEAAAEDFIELALRLANEPW